MYAALKLLVENKYVKLKMLEKTHPEPIHINMIARNSCCL